MFKNWHITRILRLVMGIIIFVQGFQSGWLFIGLGIWFSGLALFNVGCCGSGGCEIPKKTNANLAE